MISTFLLGLLLSPFAQAADSCTSAIIEDYQSPVFVAKDIGGSSQSVEINAKNTRVDIGVHVVTKEGGWADLRLCDGSAFRVGENSDFQLEDAENRQSYWAWAFQLLQGSVMSDVAPGDGEHVKIAVHTKQAALGVRGTQFVMDENDGSSSLHTLEGEVAYGPASGWSQLKSGTIPTSNEFRSVPAGTASEMKKGANQASEPTKFNVDEFKKSRQNLINHAPVQGKGKGAGKATIPRKGSPAATSPSHRSASVGKLKGAPRKRRANQAASQGGQIRKPGR
jgi:hypothetical protein